MQIITSEKNSLIKDIKSLKIKKYREQSRLFFIEGFKMVEEALISDEEIKSVIISEIAQKDGKIQDIVRKIEQKDRKTRLYSVPDSILKQLSDTETPQGIIAVVKMKDYDLIEVMSKNKKNNLFVILDSVQDPGNMGTIIRTADAADFDAVIATKGCVDFYNPKVLRSTMGSIFHIPVINANDLSQLITNLKSKSIKVYASHLNAQKYFYDLDTSKDTAIIIGNEANGISDQTASLADDLVKIPMPGKAESLNASIAAGILIYETVRQRSIKK